MSKATRSKKPRKPFIDKTGRRRWQTLVTKSGISRGAKAWVFHIGMKSNDQGTRPIWGAQVNQAKEIACSDRQVRTYRKECEEAGLIETRRTQAEQQPDGTWRRLKTNRYLLKIPPFPRRGRPKGVKSQLTPSGSTLPENINPTDLNTYNNQDSKYKPVKIDPYGPLEPDEHLRTIDLRVGVSALRATLQGM